jgi:polysaccharide biosynthesis/export protein
LFGFNLTRLNLRLRASRAAAALLVGLAAAALAGCATRGGPIAYDTAGFVQPDFVTQGDAKTLPADMPLAAFDRLAITVFRVPDLSTEYQVTGDGFIEMPLIGRTQAAGLTPNQLTQALEQAYGARYLNDPEVSIRVLESSRRNVTVEGGVRDPGVYVVPGRSDLLTVLAQAKGVDPNVGNERRVAIFRTIQGRQMAAAFDVIAIRRGEMGNPAVYPGDIVVVNSNNLRSIYRDVLQSLPILALFSPV